MVYRKSAKAVSLMEPSDFKSSNHSSLVLLAILNGIITRCPYSGCSNCVKSVLNANRGKKFDLTYVKAWKYIEIKWFDYC